MGIVKLGPIPKHIGFIMDGSRRYAQKVNLPILDGQYLGFDKLIDSFYFARSFGVTEITMYTFSIENFKRSKEEVDGLWFMFEEKLQRFRKDIPLLKKINATVKVFGDMTLIPQCSQETIKCFLKEVGEIENPEFTCYLAMAYSSRGEITKSIKKTLARVEEGTVLVDEIDRALIEKNLFTKNYKNPIDLVIRTSGETRLSDFLLWQTSNALLYFTDILWPEFKFYDFVKAIWAYQKFHFQRN